jgi:hypothetical protein
MRRVGIFLLAVIALVVMAGPVSAQPKVTITGFVDNISSWTKNLSTVDLNPARSNDTEWYARTRIRPDITAEVGTTKFVLGIEIDSTWGQTANQDTNLCLNAACSANPGVAQRFGTTSGWDLNTDVQGTLEVKWAYTEFDIPLLPVPSRMRIGAQPWEATYKSGVHATGDFAGIHTNIRFSPMVRLNMTYAFIEESSTGPTDNFIRGEDFAFITSVEITPFKGLDIRPIVSYANFIGPTSGSARHARGGVPTGGANFQTCPGVTGPGTGNCVIGTDSSSSNEDRITIGVDARWRFGPFSFDPTVLYQFGWRDQTMGAGGFATGFTPFAGTNTTLDMSAWFVDLRGGWQAGPLLLEAAAIYTTGNEARDRIDRNQSRIKFYQPISTDSGFFGTWAEIWALNIDYFNAIRNGAAQVQTISSIGYDKYGLIRVGARASYALTPAFTIRGAVNANWTAEPVDTSSSLLVGSGLTPCAPGGVGGLPANGGPNGPASALQCDAVQRARNGDAQFLGTEINVGFQWRFAPNVAFDLVGAYMFAGNALATNFTVHPATGVATSGRDPQDVQTIAARLRYSW